MAEPQTEPNGPQERDRNPSREEPSVPAEPLASVPQPPQAGDLPADVFFGPHFEPSDDRPTIISRNPRLTIRQEEALAGVLRGRRLAHFELIEPIGVGGMAAVIRA